MITTPDEAARLSGDPSAHCDGVSGDDAEFSTAELVRNFTAMLDDMNYRPALDILGVGSFQFTRRRLIMAEFRALYVGLWRLALMRSFPTRHAELFQAFMEEQAARCKNRRQAAMTAELVLQYVDKLSEHGDADFSDVARHILSLMEFDETQTRAMVLKLALHFRRVYTYFFDHLL